MADRTLIGVQNDDGYRATYCYHGGTPDWNGVILLQHFRSRDKVNRLLDGGPMTTLGPTAETPPDVSWQSDDMHAPEEPTEQVTRHYRDNGDNRDIEFAGNDVADFWNIKFVHGPDYYYLMTPEGWYISCPWERDREPEPLAQYLVGYVEERTRWALEEDDEDGD